MWEGFVLEDAAKPFLLSEDVVWRALPGEKVARTNGSYSPTFGVFEAKSGFEKKIKKIVDHSETPGDPRALGWDLKYDVRAVNMYEREEYDDYTELEEAMYRLPLTPWDSYMDAGTVHRATGISFFSPRRPFTIYRSDIATYLNRYVKRALVNKHRWVQPTPGVAGWSVWEQGYMRAFIQIMKVWRTELTADSRKLRGAEELSRQALDAEMAAGIAALEAFDSVLTRYLHYDRVSSTTDIDVQQAANWFVGDFLGVKGVAAGARGAAVSVRNTELVQFIDDWAFDVDAAAGSLISGADAVLRPVINKLLDSVLNVIEGVVGPIVGQVTSAVGSALPFIGPFIEGVVKLFGILTKSKEKPPALKWQRAADLPFNESHLDAYGTLMFRAMEQHRQRVRLAGTHTIVAPTFRTTESVARTTSLIDQTAAKPMLPKAGTMTVAPATIIDRVVVGPDEADGEVTDPEAMDPDEVAFVPVPAKTKAIVKTAAGVGAGWLLLKLLL